VDKLVVEKTQMFSVSPPCKILTASANAWIPRPSLRAISLKILPLFSLGYSAKLLFKDPKCCVF